MKELLTKCLGKVFGMLQDSKDSPLSIGRVAFLALFVLCCAWWVIKKTDAPDQMFQTLCALLIYVTGTKITDIFRPKAP